MDAGPTGPSEVPEDVRHANSELAQSERHYNDLETRYRLLASTWLLAGFGAMGYIASAENSLIPKTEFIMAISVMVSLGVQLLWVMDQFVYHRLLDANFLEGMRLESKYKALPQVRWNMWEQFREGHGVTWLVRLYYLGCSLAPLPLGTAAVLIANDEGGRISVWSGVWLVFGVVLVITTARLWQKTRNEWLARKVRELPRE